MGVCEKEWPAQFIEHWMLMGIVRVLLNRCVSVVRPFHGWLLELLPIISLETWFVALNLRRPVPNLNPINHPNDRYSRNAIAVARHYHLIDFYLVVEHYRNVSRMQLRKWHRKHIIFILGEWFFRNITKTKQRVMNWLGHTHRAMSSTECIVLNLLVRNSITREQKKQEF